jgi:hypothetical protein
MIAPSEGSRRVSSGQLVDLADLLVEGPGGNDAAQCADAYKDSYRLCYVRGPEGIIVGLAEQLS